jgi:hypothetical protein
MLDIGRLQHCNHKTLTLYSMMRESSISLSILLFFWLSASASSLNAVLAGGSGPIGMGVAARLKHGHAVTILTRNAFLAAAPNRVTEQFGWVGASFLNKFPHVQLRDWDGGDLLDIVGCDWLGWQDDTLAPANVVVHLVGGYTDQRVMACERLVRESCRVNPEAWHITVNPLDEDLSVISPGARSLKMSRIERCEAVVKENCRNSLCLRIPCYRIEDSCNEIVAAIEKLVKV